MAESLQARVARALSQVRNARTGEDIYASQSARDIATTLDGKVRFTLLIGPDDDAALVRAARQAVEAVDGVADVRVDVKDPAELRAAPPGAATGHGPGHAHAHGGPPAPAAPGAGRALPVMDAAPAQASSNRNVAAPTPVAMPALGRIVAVSSGKGGVGKSTVAVNLAVALARSGKRVGLMDADIYGPNIPMMMGLSAPPMVNERNRIEPPEAHGVKVISLGFLIERDQPAIWRGPIVMKIIGQFLRDVEWGQLDYFIVDMPPGTGDAQLSLVQTAQIHGAVIVTTPQAVSVGDALRGVKMFERVGVPVLGIVENMSWFECPHCGKPSALFGSGGGAGLAKELDLPLLGEVPLFPRVREGGDRGTPIVSADPESAAARALVQVAERVAGALAAR